MKKCLLLLLCWSLVACASGPGKQQTSAASRAQWAFKNAQYADAIRYYKQALLDTQDNTATLRYQLGLARSNYFLSRYEKALYWALLDQPEWLQLDKLEPGLVAPLQVEQLKPQQQAALGKLLLAARAHMQLGHASEAQRYAQRLLDVFPRQAIPLQILRDEPLLLNAYLVLGVALDYQQQHAQAQVVYRQALKHFLGHLKLKNNLALSLLFDHQAGQAVALLLPVYEAGISTPRIRNTLAMALQQQGQTERAWQVVHEDLTEQQFQQNQQLLKQLEGSK